VKDQAPSTLEVIGAAFLALAIPIFVAVGAVLSALAENLP
jgi:hypothetical protein